jgi:predicted nucleic acid-binding protein
MRDAVFVDTWAWVALGHRRDSRHEEIVRVFRRLHKKKPKLLTSDYLLNETLNTIFRRERFAEAVTFMEGIFASATRGGMLTIERVTEARFSQSWKLRVRFHDKPDISFTDLTSMVIMQELSVRQIVTDDAHFSPVGMNFRKLP